VLSESDAARAERLLQSAPPQAPEWTCGGCGERLAAQFTQCWRCGAYLTA